jgi:hypothetical protein
MIPVNVEENFEENIEANSRIVSKCDFQSWLCIIWDQQSG